MHGPLFCFRRKHPHAVMVGVLMALVLILPSACTGQLPLPPVIPGTPPTDARPVTAARAGTLVPAPSRAPDADLLALPAAFRYEVTLRPVQAEAPATVISGQYRGGAWAQTSHTGDRPGEELTVAPDPATGRLRSYTRASGDEWWTRWPGVTFDAAYGLASPFTVLRLRPLATRSAAPEQAAEPNATPSGAGPGAASAREIKTQALFSTEIVQRVLIAGVLAVATDEDTRRSLEDQIASLFVPQTVTYWTDPAGRVTRVASTLLSLGQDNEPIPWVEMTASYSAYDDPSIAVAAPASATDIAEVAGNDLVAEQASEVQPGVNLRVRVFATAGAAATDSVVTAYPAGKKTVADEKFGPDAQFTLKPGLYDVLVRSAGAQQWLKGVAVTQDGLASNDVLFDFAQLTVTVNLNGNIVPVDVVVYPAGETTNFAGLVSENPAVFRLQVGMYDVEAATQDGQARKRIPGVEVRSGLETTLTFDLARP